MGRLGNSPYDRVNDLVTALDGFENVTLKLTILFRGTSFALWVFKSCNFLLEINICTHRFA